MPEDLALPTAAQFSWQTAYSDFVDEGTPIRRAKPDRVWGCEIWVKIGDAPPTSPDN